LSLEILVSPSPPPCECLSFFLVFPSSSRPGEEGRAPLLPSATSSAPLVSAATAVTVRYIVSSPYSPCWVSPLLDTTVQLSFGGSDPTFFGACYFVVEHLFACRSCCVNSSIYGTLPLQTAICGGPSFPNGLGHLFNQVPIISNFIALIFSCIETLGCPPFVFISCVVISPFSPSELNRENTQKHTKKKKPLMIGYPTKAIQFKARVNI
jgi:hypothetical protein